MYNLLLGYKKTTSKLSEINLLLVVLIFALGLLGVAMIYAATGGDWLSGAKQHFYRMIFATFFMLFIAIIDLRLWYTISYPCYIMILILLISVDLMGVTVNGSKRWIDLFFLPRFQPIEVLKPFLVIILAIILCNNKLNIIAKYLFSVFLISIVSLLLIIQPDIGQTLLVVFSWAVLIFTSGINIYFLFAIFLLGSFLLAYLIIYVPKFDYIQGRIFSFFNRETGSHNFQSDKAIDSITSGGFFGKGIGEGTLKNRVPEAHTDYIISVISEEFGVVAIILILLLFLTLIYMVFKKIRFENDNMIKLILIGSISLILMQATIHIGVNIRLLTTTGMTLPFLSYGGSSIVSTSILAGIILNLTKRNIN